MATRIYIVKRKDGEGKPRLVRASGQSAALKHVVEDTLEVALASPDAVIEIMAKNADTSVEVAKEGKTSANASTN